MELDNLVQRLRRLAEDCRIRAMYHPTEARRLTELIRKKYLEEHANGLEKLL